MKKSISILGSTGSIGNSTLKVYDNFLNDIHIVSLHSHSNIEDLLALIDIYNPDYAVVSDKVSMENYFGEEETEYKGKKIYSGKEGIEKICSDKKNDIIINGISGRAGLEPSIIILENGIDLALANKESIVCAGPLMKNLSQKSGSLIIPVDSEHSAIFSLLNGKNQRSVRQIILTASGGPFLNLEKSKWNTITIQDALNHPTWKMGNKITVDSATMANKGLEVIEAHFLFGLSYDDINVLVHPQSLIHSMIETDDCEVYAQLGPNDMSIPIQNAIFYPEIKKNQYNRLDFTSKLSLDLLPVDMDKYRMLYFAYESGKKEGIYPAFYSFTNEILVNLFLESKISFVEIEKYMEKALELFYKDNSINKNEIILSNIKDIEFHSEHIIKKITGQKK